MFTGIIEEIGKVTSVQYESLGIAAKDVLQGMERGGSMAVNGVCLTITSLNTNSFSVDIMSETLKRSNLGLLRAGDKINLERPLTMDGRLGGHLVQGHIDDTGRILSIRQEGEAKLIRFETSPEVMRYVVEKGFIAVDGISLTVVTKDAGSFQVSVVGYTRQNTTLVGSQVGDMVNIEADVFAKYVEQSSSHRTEITVKFLQEHGFLVN